MPLSNSSRTHIRAEALMPFNSGRTLSSKWDGRLEEDYPHEQIQAYVFNGRNEGCLEHETVEIERVRIIRGAISTNSQTTRAVFEKEKGIGNLVDGADFDGNDPDKECVICLSEPRDTTVLPCRDKPHGFEDFHKEDVKDKLFFISPRKCECSCVIALSRSSFHLLIHLFPLLLDIRYPILFRVEEIFKDEQAEVMETDAKP
ncbi:hypothetical protein Tco_0132292 [Tanacetum coccineum]